MPPSIMRLSTFRRGCRSFPNPGKGIAFLAGLAIFLQFWLVLPAWFASELPGLLGCWKREVVLSPSVLFSLSGERMAAHALRTQPPLVQATMAEESEEPLLGMQSEDWPLASARGYWVRASPRAFRQVDERLLTYLVLRRTGAS